MGKARDGYPRKNITGKPYYPLKHLCQEHGVPALYKKLKRAGFRDDSHYHGEEIHFLDQLTEQEVAALEEIVINLRGDELAHNECPIAAIQAVGGSIVKRTADQESDKLCNIFGVGEPVSQMGTNLEGAPILSDDFSRSATYRNDVEPEKPIEAVAKRESAISPAAVRVSGTSTRQR